MSPTERASHTRRDPLVLEIHIKKVFVYMRGGLALLAGLRDRLIRVKNSAFEVFFRSKYVALE